MANARRALPTRRGHGPCGWRPGIPVGEALRIAPRLGWAVLTRPAWIGRAWWPMV